MPSKAVLISEIEALGGIPPAKATHKYLVQLLQQLKQQSKVPHTPYFSEHPFTPLPDPSPRSPMRGSALSPRICLKTPTNWKFSEKKDTMGPLTPVTPRQPILSFGAAMYLPVALTPGTEEILNGLDTIVDLGATPKSDIGVWYDSGIVSDQDVDELLTSSQKRVRISTDSQISRTKSVKVLDFSQ